MVRAIRAGEVDASVDTEATRLRGDILAQISEAVLIIDAEHRVTYFNAAAERQYGIAASEALGRCVSEIFENRWPHSDNEASAEAAVQETGHWRGEIVHVKRSGEVVEVEASVSLLPADHGAKAGVLVVIRDITDRKRAADVMEQNEALFSTIIEQAPGGVYVIDDQFHVRKMNALAMPVFAAAEPVIGREFGEVLRVIWGQELGAELAVIFRRTLETGERYISPPFTHTRWDLGQEKSYDWETQRLTLPNGKCGVVCYFTDTTEQRAQEAAVREAKEAAEAANSSKDRFLAVLSHELRTPLTPVLMAISALEHDPELRPEVREDLAMMKRNVELETKLIDDLLDLNRITSGKLVLAVESVDLNEAVRQVCGICRGPLQERELRLETTLDEAAGLVTVDAARLQQVLWNVLKNAIKFTPEQGTIRVFTKRLDEERCEVRVQDSGRGISPEVLPVIFDAFEQGDENVTRQFGGLGLGLAICKALVELHHGSIRAESAGPGQGSTFLITLPRDSSPDVGAPLDATSAADGLPGQLRLFLVEDHADTARTLGRLLRKAGYAVLTATSVASATATAEREPFDLLISDLGLPDGSGFDVMELVRKKRGVPGIAMSGYGMDDDLRRSREAGFTEHLVKPVDVPQLIAAIERVAENRG